MRNHTTVLLVVLTLGLAACGTGDVDPGGAPTEPVTVTTEPIQEPDEGDDPSPSPATGTDEAATSGDPGHCDEVAASGGESLAFVFVEEPAPGAEVAPGFEVSGCSNSFEAAYEWELLDRDGNELASGFGTATCGTGCVGTFSFAVDYTVSELEVGTLRVFTTSAQDGSVQDLNAIPLRLGP